MRKWVFGLDELMHGKMDNDEDSNQKRVNRRGNLLLKILKTFSGF
jgi:hypothetical protein